MPEVHQGHNVTAFPTKPV